MPLRLPRTAWPAAAALGLLTVFGGCETPYEQSPGYQPAEMDAALKAANLPPPGPANPALPAPNGTPVKPGEVAELAPLSLEDCLRLALENDRHVRIANRRILIARDRVDEAEASVNPQVSLDGKYEVRSNNMGSKVNGQSFIAGKRDVGTANLNLLVPIYDFGGATSTRAALQYGVEAAGFTAVAQRQATVHAVRLAYYRVLEARTIAAIVDESIQVVDRQLTVAKDFFANGLVARNDVLAVEVQKAEREDEALQAKSNLDLATATLNRLIGMELSRPTRVVDTAVAPAWADSYAKTLQMAVERRPELAGLRKQIAMAREEYNAVRYSGHNPDLYAYGSYNLSTDDTLLNQQWLVGGIGLKLPLFDGGMTYATLQRKTKEIAELIDLHDEQIDDTVLEVKQAWLALHTRQAELPVSQAAIHLAEDNLSVVQDQYAQGLASSADVLTEEDRLSRARGTNSRALYGCEEAFADLLNAVGAPLPGDPNLHPLPPIDAAPPAELAGASAGAAPAGTTPPVLEPATPATPATPPAATPAKPAEPAQPSDPAPALDSLLKDGAPAPAKEAPAHE